MHLIIHTKASTLLPSFRLLYALKKPAKNSTGNLILIVLFPGHCFWDGYIRRFLNDMRHSLEALYFPQESKLLNRLKKSLNTTFQLLNESIS